MQFRIFAICTLAALAAQDMVYNKSVTYALTYDAPASPTEVADVEEGVSDVGVQPIATPEMQSNPVFAGEISLTRQKVVAELQPAISPLVTTDNQQPSSEISHTAEGTAVIMSGTEAQNLNSVSTPLTQSDERWEPVISHTEDGAAVITNSSVAEAQSQAVGKVSTQVEPPSAPATVSSAEGTDSPKGQFQAYGISKPEQSSVLPEFNSEVAPISLPDNAYKDSDKLGSGLENLQNKIQNNRLNNSDLPPLGSPDVYLPLPDWGSTYIWPARGFLTSGFGWRWGTMHAGIDIAAPIGTPIVAAAPGVVTYAGWNNGGYGNLVEIRHGDGSITRYAHNNRVLVRRGQQVQQGEQIAEMGSTGYSTGPHCHFEIHPRGKGAVDPIAFLPNTLNSQRISQGR